MAMAQGGGGSINRGRRQGRREVRATAREEAEIKEAPREGGRGDDPKGGGGGAASSRGAKVGATAREKGDPNNAEEGGRPGWRQERREAEAPTLVSPLRVQEGRVLVGNRGERGGV